MNPEVEIRITIRDGAAIVGGRAVDEMGAPQPDPAMGGIGLGAAELAAPSPLDAAGEQVGAPAPMPDGGPAALGAGGELPSPVPLDQIEQLGTPTGGDGDSSVPSPEDAGA